MPNLHCVQDLPWKHLLQADPLLYDKEQARTLFDLRDGKNLLSEESFSVCIPGARPTERALMAERLAELFPNARILCVIRNQWDWIRSAYAHFVRCGVPTAFRHFLSPHEGTLHSLRRDGDSYIYHYPSLCDYDLVISQYEKLFGSNNITVIPFELLNSNSTPFLQKAADWIGEDLPEAAKKNVPIVNKKMGARQIAVARFCNRFVKSQFNEYPVFPNLRYPLLGRVTAKRVSGWLRSPLARLLLGDKEIEDPELREIVRSHYAESNKKLDKRYRLNLSEVAPGMYY